MFKKNLARVMGVVLPAVMLMTGCSVEFQDDRLDEDLVFDINSDSLEDSLDAIAAGEMPSVPAVDVRTKAKTGSEGEKSGTDEEAPDYKEFVSDRGWKVDYDASVIEVHDNTDPADEVDFVYTGDCGGTCMVCVTYAEGRMPDEIIEDLKSIQDKDTVVDVSGGIFPGTTDKWAYWFTPTYAEEGSGLHDDMILGEFNGGTLCFEFLTHNSGDDETDTAVSDALAMIIDSLEFKDFKPQTMYEDFPGTYTQTVEEEIEGEKIKVEYSLTFKEDHTGVLSLQDAVNIIWDDRMIMADDGSFKYYFTKKGDTVTVDYDGEKLKFTKGKK